MQPTTVRHGQFADIAPLDALMARSYPRLLAADYPPSVLVTAIPRIARAQPDLVCCGTYYLAFQGGQLLGGGGWTVEAPGGGPGTPDTGHIRHFATDADAVRQGVGRALMAEVMRSAARHSVRVLECLSTRTAVPFYQAQGFIALEEISVSLSPGVDFPAIRMTAKVAR